MIRLTEEDYAKLKTKNGGQRGAVVKKAAPADFACVAHDAAPKDVAKCLAQCDYCTPLGKEKRKRTRKPNLLPTEHQEQVAFFEWWNLIGYKKVNVDPVLCFAIPNGGHRHGAVAGKLKAEGVRAGTVDIFLAVPALGRHGLFIEMKRRPRVASEKQVDFMNAAEGVGYTCVVCYTAEEAIKAVLDYYKGKYK